MDMLVQFCCSVMLFATPWTAACQASLSITNSRSLRKLMSIESVMPSSHLTLCCPLLLLPLIFPSIRVFSHQVHAVRPCDPAEQVSGANLTHGVPRPGHLVMLSSASQSGAAPCGRQEVTSESRYPRQHCRGAVMVHMSSGTWSKHWWEEDQSALLGLLPESA